MNQCEEVLNIIVDLTNNRDIDTLNESLLKVVSMVDEVKRVRLFQYVTYASKGYIEQNLVLDINIIDDEKHLRWVRQASVVKIEANIQNCLDAGSIQHEVIDGETDCLLLPVFHAGKTIGVLVIEGSHEILSNKKVFESLVMIYGNYLLVLYESERDKLTGLYNRRTFDLKLDRLLELQRQYQKDKMVSVDQAHAQRKLNIDQEAWLVILDLDFFKKINDTFGHIYGDEVLLMFAQMMMMNFRSTDLLFRFGGEEFVVICEPAEKDMIMQVLERFRKKIEEHKFSQVKQVTVSIGFARIRSGDFAPTVIEKADKALYYAKEHGRNRVCNYEDLIDSAMIIEQVLTNEVELF